MTVGAMIKALAPEIPEQEHARVAAILAKLGRDIGPRTVKTVLEHRHVPSSPFSLD